MVQSGTEGGQYGSGTVGRNGLSGEQSQVHHRSVHQWQSLDDDLESHQLGLGNQMKLIVELHNYRRVVGIETIDLTESQKKQIMRHIPTLGIEKATVQLENEDLALMEEGE